MKLSKLPGVRVQDVAAALDIHPFMLRITDNAFIESFFHSMKADIYHGLRYEYDEDLHAALKSYVPFYNKDRLHSSLQYVPLATFEQQARRSGVSMKSGEVRAQRRSAASPLHSPPVAGHLQRWA